MNKEELTALKRAFKKRDKEIEKLKEEKDILFRAFADMDDMVKKNDKKVSSFEKKLAWTLTNN